MMYVMVQTVLQTAQGASQMKTDQHVWNIAPEDKLGDDVHDELALLGHPILDGQHDSAHLRSQRQLMSSLWVGKALAGHKLGSAQLQYHDALRSRTFCTSAACCATQPTCKGRCATGLCFLTAMMETVRTEPHLRPMRSPRYPIVIIPMMMPTT